MPDLETLSLISAISATQKQMMIVILEIVSVLPEEKTSDVQTAFDELLIINNKFHEEFSTALDKYEKTRRNG